MEHRIKILIVEDEPLIAMTLEAILKRWGYNNCRLTRNGEDALSYVQHERAELVLIDVVLGGDMDGVELAEKIRERSQAQIIFMTGYEDDLLDRDVSEIHALAWLTKPIDLDKLKGIIDSAFS